MVSPNIKSLVSTALGALDDQKPVVATQSPSQGNLRVFFINLCCELLVTAIILLCFACMCFPPEKKKFYAQLRREWITKKIS